MLKDNKNSRIEELTELTCKSLQRRAYRAYLDRGRRRRIENDGEGSRTTEKDRGSGGDVSAGVSRGGF
jgi:hypothetical protein